ncbi:exo-beta-N-acetylmuramidase NamZ family protein [Sediminibacterium ginsengisoli]|uniref:Uncharacterized conserved protein YbbC, DUF1343 family n=1 Tax=Sediminibacterium ginsengisoli TaxID=413434 RepID=A0A1T4RSK0_9BACT|nr:DUF1343 domain-containing protein [Sediminibacterium ginsengisoli]SKA18738.1 Uncharacterized conserved protein YbbC, DUF1343 family [Sediminibacterium ginsengisoli]
MKKRNLFIACILLTVSILSFNSSHATTPDPAAKPILTGADQLDKYLPLLKGKRVAIMANPTTIIGKTHLVDSLQKLGVKIVKVFGPEHGFRGNASAGVHVADETDPASGIPLVSLYGKKNKPSKEDMADIDILIYDLQDVGVRFYTNINALSRLMDACVENDKEMLILDRPNPNAYLVDGPILDMKYKSGIGMFPIPMSHGLTVGEFAMMANGEGWLLNKEKKCKLTVIPVANYDHDMPYTLPVKPSPNLNTQQAILLYPSTCMFEGTYLNHGRGTLFPFTVLGSPELKGIYSFSYTPTSIKGMSETPLFMNQECFGLDLRNYDVEKLRKSKQINISWIIELYNAHPYKEKFFDGKLSKEMNSIEIQIGVGEFRQQVMNGVSEAEIRKSWEPGLSQYKEMRKKYLLYP